MPWLHIPETLLHSFVEGSLDDGQAAQVALHLDGCEMCAARAADRDPLALAFAQDPPPELPVDLVAQALARVDRAERDARKLIPALGLGFAVAAVLVFVALGAPGQLIDGFFALGAAAGAVLRAVEIPVAIITPIWAAAAVVTFAAAAMTARRLELGGAQWR